MPVIEALCLLINLYFISYVFDFVSHVGCWVAIMVFAILICV